MPELRSEYLMRLSANLESALVLPDAPLGTRRVLHATGGTFCGPQLRGDVLQGGGDWVLDRRDGVAELDIRFALRSDDGQPIYLRCFGLYDAPAGVRQRLREGEDVEPGEYYFRTSPLFEAGPGRYAWLNRLLAVGVGRRTTNGMVTEIFAVR